MGKNKRWVQLVILTAVVLIGGYTIGSALFTDRTKVLKVGDKAPSFSLQGMDGQERSLSDYKGKYVILNFWGTFCPPCVEEMPAIQRQHAKWSKDYPLEVLGVNLSEDAYTVQSFIKRNKLVFPIVLDANRATEKKYALQNYPTTFFIDPDGRIVEIYVGGITEPKLQAKIEHMLKISS
ncbi:thiol-disulfide oxidoreductase [Paenibacillus swuensis]|uniref:Thiol-disulfide oxidoreductase n=1 Tax=Paenibacillus swuensis TaxID=1178515 RepID=A0A172TPM2_9BACL|nr:redoxin domain-containing protein [Paenibacillus swuensis]ANE49029.1 thiol-disulfide oxidoreductase [Paenibacillus swuensis]